MTDTTPQDAAPGGIGFFEKWLSVWVAMGMAGGPPMLMAAPGAPQTARARARRTRICILTYACGKRPRAICRRAVVHAMALCRHSPQPQTP